MTPIEMAEWRLRNVIKSLEDIPSGTNILAIAIDDMKGDSVKPDYKR